MKNLRMVGMICLFVGVAVQVLWGVLGSAWGISWIASFVGVMMMCIMNVIARNAEKDNKDK